MKKLTVSVLVFMVLTVLLSNLHISTAQTYTVTIAAYNYSSRGTASAKPLAAQVGETVTLTAVPSEGYSFYYWDVESGGVEIDDIYSPAASFVMNESDVRIRPVFVQSQPDQNQQNLPVIQNNHSVWAGPELQRAAAQNLIPDTLLSKWIDYTMPVTRAEFAGIVVKTYEVLADTVLLPPDENPFTDTQDTDALKAYSAELMVGFSDTEFSPNTYPDREQAATALTRAFKKFNMPGWSLASDADFSLEFNYPEPFTDDANISGWARESVYFMAANGIIQGVGGNRFAPNAATSTEEAMGYAVATREEAIVLALRIIERFN